MGNETINKTICKVLTEEGSVNGIGAKSNYKQDIFKCITKEETELNGISARWNYLESGHDKGACDGLGTTVKRSAEMDIRQK